MREQIEAIWKQFEKIKEIAFTNKDHLEFEHKDLTEWEIEKIREAQRTTSDITSYNIIDEFKKIKKLNNYIRIWYLFSILLIIWFSVIITRDYINIKIENEKVKIIKKQKEDLEKENIKLKSNLEQSQEKNNSLSYLIKQKDEQIEILKKWINETSKLNNNETQLTYKTEENKIQENTKYESISNSWVISNSWTINTQTENKKCLSNITITINVRDIAWIDGKILSFLNEWTEVEVLTKQIKNDRVWYEIKTDKITWWISGIWIEEFDSSCLK